MTAVFPGTVPSAIAQEATPQARQLAVDSALSPLPNLSAAGLVALKDSGAGIEEFVATGHEQTWRADLERILTIIVQVTGPTAGAAAQEVMASGDIEAMAEFIDSGWEAHQLVDDRASVEKLAGGDPKNVVTQWAQEALAGGDDEITEFISSGQAEAELHDQRRVLYDLAASPLPSVAAGAQQALTSNSNRVMQEYLSFGQFVAAAADQEVTDITALVDRVREETDAAIEAYEEAGIEGERAARAAEAARLATERSRDHAQVAGQAYDRAEQGARQAGELARQAGLAADDATAAADDAHAAMIRTAEAMSRAASGAARASQWSAQAQRAAAGAAGDASLAAEARRAAEESERIGKLTRDLTDISIFTAESQFHANKARVAAASAANNADAAAEAADQAAAAADDSSAAAEDARAGAGVARAAAARARAASNRVDDLIVQVSAKVEEVRQAAAEAAEQADLSAQAAYEAIEHAGDAAFAADNAGKAATRSQEAADSARKFADLATEVSELADIAQQARFDQERQLRIDQAMAEAQAQQDRNQALEKQKADAAWKATGEEFSDLVADPEVNLFDHSEEIEAWALELVEHAPEPIRGAAAVTLADGSEFALTRLAVSGYPFALAQYEQAQAQYWWENGSEDVAARAGEVVDSSEEDIRFFLTEELPELRIPVLRTQVQDRIDGLIAQNSVMTEAGAEPMFDIAISDGQRALTSNSVEELEGFLTTGFLQGIVTDARINAYNSLDTYGPNSKMAADVAIRDSDQGLIEYQFYLRPVALQADLVLEATDAQVEGLHQLNEQMVAIANQAAAEAESIHARAVEDAARAQVYSNQARGFAADAEKFSQAAQQQVTIAEGHLREAQAHGFRAAAAAGRAESDARTAESHAVVAESYSVAARQSSHEAQVAAQQAREFSQAASVDAAEAQSAADRMYAHSTQAHYSARMDAQEEVVMGNLPPEETLWSIVSEELGPQVGDLLLDLIGVTDVLDCFGGAVEACLWAAVGVVPFGKLGKLASAAPAIRDLIRKSDDIYARFKASRTQRQEQVQFPAVCSVNIAQARGIDGSQVEPIQFQLAQDDNKRCLSPRASTKSQIFRVDGRKLKTESDFRTLTAWIPNSGLDSPMKISLSTGGMKTVVPMRDDEIIILKNLAKNDKTNVLKDSNSQVQQTLRNRVNAPRPSLPAWKPFFQPKNQGKKFITVEKDEQKHQITLGRSVGGDDMQNALALHLANVHNLSDSTQARIDQRLMAFIDDSLQYIGLKRPDVQVHPTGKSNDAQAYLGGVSYEFDTTSSNRDLGHAGDFLEANNDGTVVLIELQESMFDDGVKVNLAKVLAEQRELMGIKEVKVGSKAATP